MTRTFSLRTIRLGLLVSLSATSPMAALSISLTNGDLELPVLGGVAGEAAPPTGWRYGWDVSTTSSSKYPRARQWHSGGKLSVIPSSGVQKVSFDFPSGAAQNKHDCIGKSIWAYQSIGTVAAGDVGSALAFTADGSARPSPPAVADCSILGEVSLRTGVTAASLGALKGTAASVTEIGIANSNPTSLTERLWSSRNMGKATYMVQAEDVGQEIFVVVRAKVLTFSNQGNIHNQGPVFFWDSAVLSPKAATLTLPATADDHRVEMKIDKYLDILPPGSPPGMMKMVKAPDGTIYLNTQSSVAQRALLKSTDGGTTWNSLLVKFTDPRVWPSQTISGFTVTRDGQLWAVHQAGMIDHGGVAREVKKPWPEGKVKPLWVSRSSDGGGSWTSTKIDVGPLVPPGGRKAPYVKAMADYVCLIELSDGTVMFPVNMFYQEPDSPNRPFVMLRTRDGGKTWGDPTFVREIEVKSRKYQTGATETDFAVDPKDPDHILAMSRKQRPLVPGEDKETVYRQARAPLSFPYPFKGSQLLESTDGGRTFEEVPNAYTGLYGHRGSICWTDRDVVIASYMFNPDVPQGARMTGPLGALRQAAAISLDGGKTWVDGTKTGTTNFEKAKRFILNHTHAGTNPTIEVVPNRYLTVCVPSWGGALKGFYWHLVDASGKVLRLPSVKATVEAKPVDAPAARAPAVDQARREAIRRQRRLIFNNDGYDLYFTPSPATKEGFLSVAMDHVANTGVDSVFYWYSPATPFYGRPGAIKLKRAAELIKQGTDPLKLIIEACRKNNIEIFWTLRMNDIHDALPTGSISNWKAERRHLLMGQPQDQGEYPQSDPRWYWTFVDFAQQEVRDLMVTVIRNVVNKYDVDGIDLDFLRHPAHFKETRIYEPVTKEHLDMLTDMVGKIRKEVLAASKRKERPILLAVRILPTLELNKRFGFDIKRWLKQDYVDLITISGGYDPFTVTVSGKEMIDFGHAYDIPVYVCLSRSGFQHAGFDTIESWRAAAANVWAAGADGITTFNLFPNDPDPRLVGTDPTKFARLVWSEIGDPQVLVRKDKFYCIEQPPQSAFNCGSVPVEGRLPVRVRKGKSIERLLPVADDIPGLKDRLENLRLRIYLSGLQSNDVVNVKMNGNPIEMAAEKPQWVAAEVDPSVMKKGSNILAVTYQAGSSESLTITSVELAVDYID